jgi:hypothetical protein
MATGQPESLLETARRHSREGEERLAQQEATVAKFQKKAQPEAAALAKDVLETMRNSLDLMKRHLRQIEEKY